MTNPELIPEKAGGNLPAVSPPTTAPTDGENISLNPLFQPDLLEHLAQTIIQELQRHDLKAELPPQPPRLLWANGPQFPWLYP